MIPPTAMSPTTMEVGRERQLDEARVSADGGLGRVTIVCINVPLVF